MVAAPTASGKTGVIELAILRMLAPSLSGNGLTLHREVGAQKAIYVAPMRALVQEKSAAWRDRFRHLHLHVAEMTGDAHTSGELDAALIRRADIILTTPEKFDAITRRCHRVGGVSWIGDISLVVIDEVHLLGDRRGAVLEALVARLQILQTSSRMEGRALAHLRLGAVSATVANAPDVAQWLGCPPGGLRIYGDEMRPVPLAIQVRGWRPDKRGSFMFEKHLTSQVWPVIVDVFSAAGYAPSEHPPRVIRGATSRSANPTWRGKPTLVFCATRSGCLDTAKAVSRAAQEAGVDLVRSVDQRQVLQEGAQRASTKALGDLIRLGVAFHHAGLKPEDRELVEGLFASQQLSVLCATCTLAVGVNLPAHLVVVKGTMQWVSEEQDYKPYDSSLLLQMAGRAGRPDFDTRGRCEIMTSTDHLAEVERQIRGSEVLESCLLARLHEALNSEIVLGSVTTVADAVLWFMRSFCFIRMGRNPEHYGVPPAAAFTRERLTSHVEVVVRRHVEELVAGRLVRLGPPDPRQGVAHASPTVHAEEPARLMSFSYLSFPTMRLATTYEGSGSVSALVDLLAHAEELASISLRRNQKKVLNEINQHAGLRFFVTDPKKRTKPVARIKDQYDKIVVLLGHALRDTPVDGDDTTTKAAAAAALEWQLHRDEEMICDTGERVFKMWARVFLDRGHFQAAVNCHVLARCVKHRRWETSQYLLIQCPKIGPVVGNRLARRGIRSLVDLTRTDPRTLELHAGKGTPWGNQVQSDARALLPPPCVLRLTWNTSGNQLEGRVELFLRPVRGGVGGEGEEGTTGGAEHGDQPVITVAAGGAAQPALLRTKRERNKRSRNQPPALLLCGDLVRNTVLVEKKVDIGTLADGPTTMTTTTTTTGTTGTTGTTSWQQSFVVPIYPRPRLACVLLMPGVVGSDLVLLPVLSSGKHSQQLITAGSVATVDSNRTGLPDDADLEAIMRYEGAEGSRGRSNLTTASALPSATLKNKTKTKTETKTKTKGTDKDEEDKANEVTTVPATMPSTGSLSTRIDVATTTPNPTPNPNPNTDANPNPPPYPTPTPTPTAASAPTTAPGPASTGLGPARSPVSPEVPSTTAPRPAPAVKVDEDVDFEVTDDDLLAALKHAEAPLSAPLPLASAPVAVAVAVPPPPLWPQTGPPAPPRCPLRGVVPYPAPRTLAERKALQQMKQNQFRRTLLEQQHRQDADQILRNRAAKTHEASLALTLDRSGHSHTYGHILGHGHSHDPACGERPAGKDAAAPSPQAPPHPSAETRGLVSSRTGHKRAYSPPLPPSKDRTTIVTNRARPSPPPPTRVSVVAATTAPPPSCYSTSHWGRSTTTPYQRWPPRPAGREGYQPSFPHGDGGWGGVSNGSKRFGGGLGPETERSPGTTLDPRPDLDLDLDVDLRRTGGPPLRSSRHPVVPAYTDDQWAELLVATMPTVASTTTTSTVSPAPGPTASQPHTHNYDYDYGYDYKYNYKYRENDAYNDHYRYAHEQVLSHPQGTPVPVPITGTYDPVGGAGFTTTTATATPLPSRLVTGIRTLPVTVTSTSIQPAHPIHQHHHLQQHQQHPHPHQYYDHHHLLHQHQHQQQQQQHQNHQHHQQQQQ